MFDGTEEKHGDGADKKQGDGLHHHEIHEDEAGGYHSKHTHPDGRVEHEEHPTFDHAMSHAHEMFGHEEPDGDESDGGDGDGDMDADDIAGSYGRAAHED